MIEAIGGSSKAALSGHQSDIYIPLGYCVLVLLIAGSLNPCAIVAACSTSITSRQIFDARSQFIPERHAYFPIDRGSCSKVRVKFLDPDIYPFTYLRTYSPRHFALPEDNSASLFTWCGTFPPSTTTIRRAII